jgi:hypothetical protein
MYQNRIWLLFLSFVFLLDIVFITKTISRYTDYKSFSHKTPVRVERFELKEGKGDVYWLTAKYFFNFKGKTFSGTSTLGRAFKNPWSAQAELSKWQSKKELNDAVDLHVWLNPREPLKTTFEKAFPIQLLFSSIVLTALLVYLVCLGVYLGRKHGRPVK